MTRKSPSDLEITYHPNSEGVLKSYIPDGNKALVLDFIAEHSLKEPEAIAAVVQEFHDGILEAISPLTEEQALVHPAGDDWCILDAMAHVVTTKQICAGLCASLSSGSRPPGIGPEWEEEAVQDGITNMTFESLASARDAADSAHTQLLEAVSNLGSADLSVTFKHYIFGELNAREWAVFQRIHDGDHIAQIQKMSALVAKF